MDTKELETFSEIARTTGDSRDNMIERNDPDESCFNLNNYPRIKGSWKFIRENKSYILNYMTIIINIIVFTILLSSTTDKVKELDGIVKGQRILWDEFLGQFPNISSSYQRVIEIQSLMRTIEDDINKSSIQMSLINSVNSTKLQSVLLQSDKVDPLNERIELYNKILSHNISASDFDITTCPVILVIFEATGTDWFSDCVYQLCENRLMRVLIKNTNEFSAKICIDDKHLLRYKNGILKYNMSVSLINNQVGIRLVCQEPLYESKITDGIWIVKGQFIHNDAYMIAQYPDWNYTIGFC